MNLMKFQDAHVQCILCWIKGIEEFVYVGDIIIECPQDVEHPGGIWLTNEEVRTLALEHLKEHGKGVEFDTPIGVDGFIVTVGGEVVGVLSVLVGVENGLFRVTDAETNAELISAYYRSHLGPEVR